MFAACVVTATASFVLGIVFAKSVLNEAASLKTHFTAEVQKLRGDLSRTLQELEKKV